MKIKNLFLGFSLLLVPQQSKAVEIKLNRSAKILGAVAVVGVFVYLLKSYCEKHLIYGVSQSEKDRLLQEAFELANYNDRNAHKDFDIPNYARLIFLLGKGADPLVALKDYLTTNTNGFTCLKINRYYAGPKPKPTAAKTINIHQGLGSGSLSKTPKERAQVQAKYEQEKTNLEQQAQLAELLDKYDIVFIEERQYEN